MPTIEPSNMEPVTQTTSHKQLQVDQPADSISESLNQVLAVTEKQQKISPFTNITKFEEYQRMAQILSKSSMVPKAYQNNIGDCVIAMEIADRIGTSPFMVMQSLYVVHGNPGWSAQWVIAMLNSCGRFSPVQFEMSPRDTKPTKVEYIEYEWAGGKKSAVTKTTDIYERTCRAKVRDLKTGEMLLGPEVSISMAVKEGWYTKPGSKWKTLEELMLMYRSGSFLGKLYAPDLLMGMQTAEELRDMRELDVPDQSTVDNQTQTRDDLNEEMVKIAASKKPTPQHQTEQPATVDKTAGEGVDTKTGEIIEEENVAPVGRQQKPAPKKPAPKKPATATIGKKPSYSFNQILGKIDDAQTEIAVDDAESDKEFVDELTDTLRKEISDYALRRKRAIAKEG